MYAQFKDYKKGTQEIFLDFPRKFVEDTVGLGIDIGGSSIKLVYRHKDDWNDLQNNKELSSGKMRLRTCSRDGLDDMIKHVKDFCYITRDKDGSAAVGCSGGGGMQFGNKLKEELNVELNFALETDAFVKAFNYLLKNFKRADIVSPPCQDVIDEELKRQTIIWAQYEQASEFTSMTMHNDKEETENKTEEKNDKVEEVKSVPVDDSNQLSEAENLFPSMLMMCGSGFGFLTVKEDGSYEMKDGSQRGGKYFLGLGSLVTGAQTFDELVSLASKGNANKIDITADTMKNELQPPEGEEAGEDIYNMHDEDMPDDLVYCFGQAAGKDRDSFSREDLAAAVLKLVCLDLVHTAHQACRISKAKQAFFSGGFPSVPFVQTLLTDLWYKREFEATMMQGEVESVKLNFLPHGQFLAALGTIIT